MHRRSYFLAAALILFFAFSTADVYPQSSSWDNYRGPQHNGHSNAVNIPLQWNDSMNIAWKTPIEGKGWSSPVVLNRQVWITTAAPDGSWFDAICLDENDGSVIFNIRVFEESEPLEIHPLNSYASPSPVIEQGSVYVHFGTYGTARIDTGSGKIIWKRQDINCDHEVGPGSSPVIYKNMLILTMDGVDVQYLEALDKETGKTIWKQHRGLDFSALPFDRKKAFFTPIFKEVDGQTLLLSPGPHAIMGYLPETGEQVWIVHYEGFSGSSQPITGNGIIYFNTGFGKSSIIAIKLGGKGDQTANAIKWLNEKSLQARSSPILIDGYIYTVNTGGQAKCLDAMTGEEIWTERVGRQTSASPVYAEGKIFTFDEEGLCTIYKPGRSYMKIAENQLPDGVMSSPAIIDGAIIIRTKTALYKISIL